MRERRGLGWWPGVGQRKITKTSCEYQYLFERRKGDCTLFKERGFSHNEQDKRGHTYDFSQKREPI